MFYWFKCEHYCILELFWYKERWFMLLFTAWITITADETPMEIDLELNKPIVEQTCNLSHSVYLEEAPCFKATYGSALTQNRQRRGRAKRVPVQMEPLWDAGVMLWCSAMWRLSRWITFSGSEGKVMSGWISGGTGCKTITQTLQLHSFLFITNGVWHEPAEFQF